MPEGLNGLGSPFGFETDMNHYIVYRVIRRLNGLGSPFGFETKNRIALEASKEPRLNGLGSPFGFETPLYETLLKEEARWAKWPGKPVRV